MTYVDILLVTATKVEREAVLQVFCATQSAIAKHIVDHVYFDIGTVNGARVYLMQCEMGSGSIGASQQAVAKGIDALSPSVVIMVGIAFGLNEEKQKIGDILVSKQLRPYDLQRVGTGTDGDIVIKLRDDKPHASDFLLNLLRSSESTWKDEEVDFGTVLSGSNLVDSLGFRNQLSEFETEAIGGEMEGAGLYVACHDKKVDWILVKAICDFADGHKSQDKKARQELAARNSAKFVKHALEFVQIDWDSRRTHSAPKLPDARFRTFEALAKAVNNLLLENRAVFDEFGPRSATAEADPSSNLHTLWKQSRKNIIVPNNSKIIEMVSNNIELLSSSARSAFIKFRLHAEAYEHHINSPLDRYPLFPQEFAEEFRDRA